LQEGLARISQDLGEQGKYFPNKVFLTSLNLAQKMLHKEQAELQAFDWTQITGFLQAPEFVVLEVDYLIKALSLAASQMLSKKSNLAVAQKDQSVNDIKEETVSSFGII
jgi:hypothetical protein